MPVPSRLSFLSTLSVQQAQHLTGRVRSGLTGVRRNGFCLFGPRVSCSFKTDRSRLYGRVEPIAPAYSRNAASNNSTVMTVLTAAFGKGQIVAGTPPLRSSLDKASPVSARLESATPHGWRSSDVEGQLTIALGSIGGTARPLQQFGKGASDPRSALTRAGKFRPAVSEWPVRFKRCSGRNPCRAVRRAASRGPSSFRRARPPETARLPSDRQSPIPSSSPGMPAAAPPCQARSPG